MFHPHQRAFYRVFLKTKTTTCLLQINRCFMAKILFLIQNFVDTFSIIFLTYTDVRMFSFFSTQYLEKKEK
jgi:hypothetical protein